MDISAIGNRLCPPDPTFKPMADHDMSIAAGWMFTCLNHVLIGSIRCSVVLKPVFWTAIEASPCYIVFCFRITRRQPIIRKANGERPFKGEVEWNNARAGSTYYLPQYPSSTSCIIISFPLSSPPQLWHPVHQYQHPVLMDTLWT